MGNRATANKSKEKEFNSVASLPGVAPQKTFVFKRRNDVPGGDSHAKQPTALGVQPTEQEILNVRKDIPATTSSSSNASYRKKNFNLQDQVEDMSKQTLPQPPPVKRSVAELEVGIETGSIIVRVTFTKTIKGLFKFYAMDETAEIEVLCRYEQRTKFEKLIKVNGTYQIRNFRVVDNSKAPYPNATGGSLVIEAIFPTFVNLVDEDGSIPAIPFNFCDFDQESLRSATTRHIDVLAVAIDVGETVTGPGWVRKVIRLSDRSYSDVSLTIWGVEDCKVEIQVGDCVALRRVEIGEWAQKKTLNSGWCGTIWVHPVLPNNEGEALEKWYQDDQAALAEFSV